MIIEKFNLSANEIKIAELVARSLAKNCIGKERAIHRDALLEKLASAKKPIVIDRWQLSEMIQYIRVNNLCGPVIEIAQSYYISFDEAELSNYIIVLEQRSNEIMRMKFAIEQQLNKIKQIQ